MQAGKTPNTGWSTRIIKNLGHTSDVDISELFDSVSRELGVGRSSAVFCPYSELRHTWRRVGTHASFQVSDYLEGASPDVLESLAWYLVSKAFRIPTPHGMSEKYLDCIASEEFWQSRRYMYLERAKNLSLDPHGIHRDLSTIFDYVSSTYFRGAVRDPTLAWVRESPARRLGFYFEPLNLLAVNRVLDAERIPRFVLEFVVYHELLHHMDAGSGRRNRRVHHTRRFREQERLFSSYAEAEKWLNRLVAEHRLAKKRAGVPRA
jgi:hypothetical protein